MASKQDTKLTLEMYRYDNVVVGKCKYLKEGLEGTGVLQENTRYQICSDVEPGIVVADGQKTKLNVWGNNEAANDLAFHYAFEDAEQAEEFTLNITRLYNRLNGIEVSTQTLVKVL